MKWPERFSILYTFHAHISGGREVSVGRLGKETPTLAPPRNRWKKVKVESENVEEWSGVNRCGNVSCFSSTFHILPLPPSTFFSLPCFPHSGFDIFFLALLIPSLPPDSTFPSVVPSLRLLLVSFPSSSPLFPSSVLSSSRLSVLTFHHSTFITGFSSSLLLLLSL